MFTAGILVMALNSTYVQSQEPYFGPVAQSGYLGYDYNLIQSDVPTVQTHTALFNWNVASYIKQPYIAQYFGGITFNYNQVDAVSNDGERYSIFGNLTLRLFPMSKFPFEAYFREENSETNRTLDDLSTTRTTYGLVQRFTSKKKTSVQFRFEQNRQTFDDRLDDRDQFGKNELADLDISKVMGRWSFRWQNQYDHLENSSSRFSTQRLYSVLRHTWQPAPVLSMNGFSSYRDIAREDADLFSIHNRQAEFNNYLFWRPDTRRPMLLSSSFRHVELFNDSGNPEDGNGGITALSGAFSYQISDRLSLAASALGTAIRSGEENDFLSASRLEGRWTSPTYRWNTVSYQWDTALGAETDDRPDEWGNVVTGVAQLGHAMDKVFFRDTSPLVLRFSQHLIAFEGSDTRSTQQLSQHLALNWNRLGNQRSSSVNISISDFRSTGGGGRVGDENQEFQLATLLFSQTENYSRVSQLIGSASLQVRRQQADAEVDTGSTPSGSADLTYFNRMLFQVPGLQFRSSLRWYSTNFRTSQDDETMVRGTQGTFWENRLDYSLGRLDLRLITRLTAVNDISRNFIFFQVRRNFGGLFN